MCEPIADATFRHEYRQAILVTDKRQVRDKGQALEKVDARVVWTEQIEEALRDGHFELHYQPIMEIVTGKIRRTEALIRIRNADRGLIFPDSFIPVAEKTGQIQAIDHWVLKRAVETMARRPELNISVNLSANAMEDETILPEIQRLLEVWEIEANRLTLEITETAAVSSLLNATRLMRRIQDLGCRFALENLSDLGVRREGQRGRDQFFSRLKR